ncbi:hypothetical protein ACVW0I_003393 [Bradyrhizobium sp. LM6.11]
MAGIDRLEFDDLVGIGLEQVRPAQQDLAALGRPHRAPGAFEGPARGGNRMLDIGFVAFGDNGDDLPGGRIERFEGATGACGDAAAVDQQKLGPGHELRGRRMRKIICN